MDNISNYQTRLKTIYQQMVTKSKQQYSAIVFLFIIVYF